MKEIKFRIWNQFSNRMIYPDENNGLLITLDGKILSEIVSGNGKPTGSYYDYTNDFVLMQYTGIKDENNKEIYEGDIVKLEGWGINIPSMILKVVWRDGCYYLDTNEYNYSYVSGGKNLYVIGNIFENGDIL